MSRGNHRRLDRVGQVVESETTQALDHQGRMRDMQFGIFTVGDVTPDPTTGRTPTEHERIKATIEIAKKAEEVGLDVVAVGEHHNPPFIASAPTTTLAYIGAQTVAGDPLDVDDADHDHRPGADRGELRQAPAPHRRPRRPDDGPRQHRPGLPVVRQGHPRGHQPRDRELPPPPPPLARGRRGLGGQVPYAAPGLHLHAAAAGRRTAVRLARLDPLPRDRRAGGVLRRRVLRQPHLLAGVAHRSGWSTSTAAASSTTATAPPTRRSSASAARCSCGTTARTPSRSSARTSTTPRSTATARRWRTSPARRRSPSARRSRSSSAPSASVSTPATTSASCS